MLCIRGKVFFHKFVLYDIPTISCGTNTKHTADVPDLLGFPQNYRQCGYKMHSITFCKRTKCQRTYHVCTHPANPQKMRA